MIVYVRGDPCAGVKPRVLSVPMEGLIGRGRAIFGDIGPALDMVMHSLELAHRQPKLNFKGLDQLMWERVNAAMVEFGRAGIEFQVNDYYT